MDDVRSRDSPAVETNIEELPLKADPFAQLTLLDVQRHDSSLAQLTHRKKTLPEHAALTELTARHKELDGRRVEAETIVSDLGSEQRKADGEVEQVKARRVRDQQRLDSGMVSNPKDLESLQHEIVALDRRIDTLEEEELEVMERLEQAQKELDVVRAEAAEVAASIEQNETSRDRVVGELDAETRELVAEREQTAANIPEALLMLYDKVRGQQGGLAAAALRQRQCEGCRLELNAADLREIAAMPSDEVVRCPECNRILVRTGESGL